MIPMRDRNGHRYRGIAIMPFGTNTINYTFDLVVQAVMELTDHGPDDGGIYDFNHDLTGIRKALGAVPVLKGGDPEMVTKWNRGMLPAMAVHPKSGGHGLNLQFGGHVLIWYSLNWDLELYQQMVKRLDRQGQENKVLVYQLVAADTVDETVVRCLEKKDADQRSLLAALKEDMA